MSAMLIAFLASQTSPAPACYDIRQVRETEVSLEGRLTLREFAGTPSGGRSENVYILELARPLCVYDGTARSAVRVHLYTSHDLWNELRAARGKHVEVHGSGLPGITGHHRTPFVVNVDRITVKRP